MSVDICCYYTKKWLKHKITKYDLNIIILIISDGKMDVHMLRLSFIYFIVFDMLVHESLPTIKKSTLVGAMSMPVK